MKSKKSVHIAITAALVSGVISSQASAAGFALIENSASGMGNAFAGAAAIAEDASTIYFNPAGLSKLDGQQIVVAGHVVRASADFSNNGSTLSSSLGGGSLLGGNDISEATALIPNFYYANKLNDKWAFGLGINVPFGQSTNYSDTWAGRYHATKSEIASLNINPSASFKVNDKLSVGFGVSAQYFEATLANQIDSRAVCLSVTSSANCNAAGLTTLGDVNTDSSVSLNGDDWSFGWNVGLLYDINDETRLGFAYRSNVKQSIKGTADFTRSAGLNAILGASTAFADASITTGINLPETLSLSLNQAFNSKWTMLADVTWTKWSRFDKLVVDYDSAQPTTTIPENWEDSLRYSLGVNYQADEKWIYRAGLALDETPIGTAEDRTARLPDADRTWLSFGFGYKVSKTSSVDVGYTHIFFDDAAINNSSTASFGHTLAGNFDVSVDIFSAQYNWKF